jgi:hypothetical protein
LVVRVRVADGVLSQGRRSVTIQAQSFDGAIHEFPDGTDPAVIDQAVKQYTQSKQQQPRAANPSVTFNDRAGSMFGGETLNPYAKYKPVTDPAVPAQLNNAAPSSGENARYNPYLQPPVNPYLQPPHSSGGIVSAG